VRISADLVRVRDQTQLWGDVLEREMSGILALEKDSSYAPAHAGRAWVWVARSQMGIVSPDEAGPKAKAAAAKAIELDENLAAAHEVMGAIRTSTDWDWDGGRESYGRAIELDPFNPLTQSFYAMVLYSQRRYDEAIAAAGEALRFQPEYPLAAQAVWFAMHEKGMEAEAFKAAETFANVTENDPRLETALEEGYARGGYAEAMKRAAEAMIARLPETYSAPSAMAQFYASAGEKEETLEWLKKGIEAHDPSMPYIGIVPLFDLVRDDPRFQELLRKMGLPGSPPP
jgi:tetratricopeptide (TPR) repeat protein